MPQRHTNNHKNNHSFKESGKACPSKKSFKKYFGQNHDLIVSKCKTISTFKTKNGKTLNAFQWVQDQINKKSHPDAILKTFDRLSDKKTFHGIGIDPYGYANKIIKIESQNFYEQENINKHKQRKAEKIDLSAFIPETTKSIAPKVEQETKPKRTKEEQLAIIEQQKPDIKAGLFK